jgi:hypothetical protein
MYTGIITTAEQALAHLFFHFCKNDGTFDKAEIDFIADKFVQMGIQHSLDLKEEVKKYQSYQADIKNDGVYLEWLIQLIHPVNTLALFSCCTEICLSDGLLSTTEEKLLDELGAALQIEVSNRQTTKQVMIERKAVELQKIF